MKTQKEVIEFEQMVGRGCAQRDGVGDSSGDKDRARNANISLRKVTKTRISFPNEGAVLKLLYLALRNIAKKYTMPIHDWKAALNRFAIIYEDRLPGD